MLSQHFLFPVLFSTGFMAGMVDAIAGGGGLISLPVLLSLGISPHVALGTNKLQSSCGALISAHSYYRQGLIDKHKILVGLIFTFLGAVIGVGTIELLDGSILKKIIPVLLIIILIYTLLTPQFGKIKHPVKMQQPLFFSLFGFLLGFYDGFLGPGTGLFWIFVLMFFVGFGLIQATAYTKVFNLTSNLVALACFAAAHQVDYRLGLYMAGGQFIGGRLGAYLAIKKGASLIRPIFVSVVIVTIAVLFYKSYQLR